MRWRLLCCWDSVSRTVTRHETVFTLRMLVRHLLKPILSLARERRTIDSRSVWPGFASETVPGKWQPCLSPSLFHHLSLSFQRAMQRPASKNAPFLRNEKPSHSATSKQKFIRRYPRPADGCPQPLPTGFCDRFHLSIVAANSMILLDRITHAVLARHADPLPLRSARWLSWTGSVVSRVLGRSIR